MAGTDRQQLLMTDGPAVVLVEPQLGENIGMVARAMANFGLSELRLVRPRDGWPNAKAQAWLDKFAKLYKHQIPAGSWIMSTAVKAWANAVANVGDAYNFKAVNEYLQKNGYEGELGLIKWDKENVLRAQAAAPINHYQVQGGELQTIFTDPPLTPYPGATFKVPGWIKK